jgi:hypothetical protein
LNQRLLIGESYLDESVQLISEMAKLQSPPQVLEYSKRLGPASIRALYKWAYDHADSGLGVDLQWRRKQQIRAQLFEQKPEFQKLHETIGFTSEENITEETVYANLVGADIERQSFHLKLDGGEEIRGRLSEALVIGEKQPVELPRRYKVTIKKTQRIRYSTEEEDISYQLLSLEQV